MQRLCFVSARTFCHSSAGSSGWCCKHDLSFWIKHLKHFNDCTKHRCFPCTRRTCDDGQITAKRHIYSLALPLGKGNTKVFPDKFERIGYVQLHRRHRQHFRDFPGCFILLNKAVDLINVPVARNNFSLQNHILYDSVYFFRHYFDLPVRGILVEQLYAYLCQCGFIQIEMSFFAALRIQSCKHGSMDSHRGIQRHRAFPDNGIDSFEAEPGYLTQLIWILLQNVHTSGSKMLINLHSGCGRNIEGCEQDHQIPDTSALRIRGFDILQLIRGDSTDFKQALGFFLQYAQGVCSKTADNQRRRFFTDSLNQSG